MNQNRRRILSATASLGVASALPRLTWAQVVTPAWPAKPIRVIVGFPPGGLTDILARAYSEPLSQQLGRPVIVENKPGAASMIAAAEVARAAPDGYTFLFTISGTINQNRVLYKKMSYDPDKDFAYVSGIDAGHLPLAVSSSTKITTMREFVEFAKRERTTIGTYAAGSYPHMIAQQLNKLYGTQVDAVHYKGEAQMWADCAAGQITAAAGSIGALLPHLQSGRVRPIAVPTATRSPRLPDVPTFLEQGFKAPVFMLQGWIGMFGPAGLPAEIVTRISAINQAAADTPRIKQIHTNFGLPDKPWSAAEFERINNELKPLWVGVAQELGVTLD